MFKQFCHIISPEIIIAKFFLNNKSSPCLRITTMIRLDQSIFLKRMVPDTGRWGKGDGGGEKENALKLVGFRAG
ncbi:MAG: hypothetical protein D3908_00185 [Candidatus Electrothrix sp. AUS4]|nr:hypothetical protein [Candidatus Electrothrix sp. AUS4]